MAQMRNPWPSPADAVELTVEDLALRTLDRLDSTLANIGGLFKRDTFIAQKVSEAEIARRAEPGRVTVVDSRGALDVHRALARALGEAWDHAKRRGWLADEPGLPGFVYVTLAGKERLASYRRDAAVAPHPPEVDRPADPTAAPGESSERRSENAGSAAVTVFISWAHGDDAWSKTIASFALKLRELGIAADVDLFHLDDQDVNWTTYGPQAIEDNDFVLVTVSRGYKERWEGRHDPRTGAGAAREANVLKAFFNDDQDRFLRRTKVVVLPGATTADIPAELRAAIQHFNVSTIDLDGLEPLLRNLTGQPSVPANAVGDVPLLPPTLLGTATPPTGTDPRPPGEDEQGLRDRIGQVEREISATPAGTSRASQELATRRSTMEAALDAIHPADGTYDVFISYAGEDRETIARPLKDELETRGLRVWFDKTVLVAGQSLRRSIDRGLALARVGVVILSPSFFGKGWPEAELDGLMAREKNEPGILIPVWHEVDAADVRKYSVLLSDIVALKSQDGVPAVADGVIAALEGLARGASAEESREAGKAAATDESAGRGDATGTFIGSAPAVAGYVPRLRRGIRSTARRVRRALAVFAAIGLVATGYVLVHTDRGSGGDARERYVSAVATEISSLDAQRRRTLPALQSKRLKVRSNAAATLANAHHVGSTALGLLRAPVDLQPRARSLNAMLRALSDDFTALARNARKGDRRAANAKLRKALRDDAMLRDRVHGFASAVNPE